MDVAVYTALNACTYITTNSVHTPKCLALRPSVKFMHIAFGLYSPKYWCGIIYVVHNFLAYEADFLRTLPVVFDLGGRQAACAEISPYTRGCSDRLYALIPS